MAMNKLANRPLICALIQEKKYSYSEIATIAGCSYSSVSKVASENGLQSRKNTQYVTHTVPEWKAIVEAFRTRGPGTITEFCKIHNVNRSTLYAHIRRL